MKKLFLFALFIASLSAFAQFKYPATRTVDSSDTYFGTTYKDPYRWLEYIKTPEVETWFKQQADYSNSILNNISGRDELIAEWKKLDKLQPPLIRDVVHEGGRLFYRKTAPGESVGKLYYREGYNGKEQLLFDPLTYIKGKPLSLQSATPSYDGKKVAITYSQQGAEVSVMKIMDVESKKFMKDSLYPLAWGGGWTLDNKAVFYSLIKSADNKDPEQRLNSKWMLHTVGADAGADVDYFSNAAYPELKIDPSVYPNASVARDAPAYIFADEFSVQSEKKGYYAALPKTWTEKVTWKVLCTPADKLVRSFDVVGDNAYAITYNGAKNYKLVTTSLKNPDWNNAAVIGPERKNQVLSYFIRSKDYLLMVYNDGINDHVSKYNLRTKQTTDVKLPFSGSVYVSCIDTKTNDCMLGISSWAKPYTEFSFNPVNDAFGPSAFNKPPVYPAEYQNLVVEEVEVKGHDGVMIPLSIIHKKGIKMDGSNTCLMDSYGAYGYSMMPWFDVRESALAVKGVVIGIPHVRGGGEKGENWYRAGYKTTKPNTWKDFISCADYMVQKGYTSKSKMAGTGTSAGGVLITRAITERPDLFAAAICNVGCANALRLEFSSNGPANVPEFGTVKDSVECKALYEMDGMQHVKPGVAYPAVISIAGWNDSRVVPWQPGKFAAAVQSASTSGKPVLLKVNYDNGHFTEDKNVTYANFADQFAFAMWQCGHPDFQLRKGM